MILAPDDLITVDEVASKLRVKRSWVYSHADKLGAYRLGKYLRFSWERVLKHLESASVTSTEVGVIAQRPSLSREKQEPYKRQGTDREQKGA